MPALPFELFVGLRYLKAKRKQTFISVITFISMAGVAVGVWALLTVISVMTGAQADIREKILGMTAHIQLLPFDRGLPNADRVAEAVERVPGVVAAAPFVASQAMLTTPAAATGAVVYGIEPARAARVTNLAAAVREGDLAALGPGDLLLGEELARALGVVPGSRVNLVSPLGQMSPVGPVPRIRPFRVAGTFRTGNYEYDSGLAFMHLADAQRFFDLEGLVSGLEIRVEDVYAADRVARELETNAEVRAAAGAPFFARDWQQRYRNLFAALKLEKTMMFIILTLIILVAAFNIVSTLIMVVMEKHKDIAILKAMGATGRRVMRVFVLEGLVIGLVGTVAGLLLGIGTVELISRYEIGLDPTIYPLERLPARLEWANVVLVTAAAVGISALATLYPSWQAARLDPVEAIRYE
ncbi:MAG TPA: lipoprotein-releasing ABC transporter permease subunit [Thermodesulfobacteriota bacterium]|nr:lipoprotein-releasing ABC transporter permease subunit [Thermodesulfobacteriota bacterium]